MRARSSPSITSVGNYTRIAHTEEFAPVVPTGTAYVATTYQCNPGVSSCFPWLAAIAARFEIYKFRSLKFHFKATCPSTTPGSITMAFDYDAIDAAPVTMAFARSYRDMEGGGVWADWTLNCDLQQGDRLPEKYVRIGLPANIDLKTYDVGNLHVCTEGVGAVNVGYLQVEYVVDLFTPQIQNGLGGTFSYTSVHGAPFTALLNIDPDTVLPFVVTSTTTVQFFCNWEGMLIAGAAGTVLTNFTIAASGTVGSAVGLINPFIVNGAGLIANVSYRIRALPGTILTFAATDTTHTSTSIALATAPFEGLNYTLGGSMTTPCSSTSTSTSTTSHVSQLARNPLSDSAILAFDDYKRMRSQSAHNTH